MTVSGTSEVEHTPAKCSGCDTVWDNPRTLAWLNTVKVPADVSPWTHETVVPFKGDNNLHRHLFETLRFCKDDRWLGKTLVKEFEYDTSNGEIFYDCKAQEERENNFAKLITLNSWYVDLMKALLFMALSVMDIQANLTLCAALIIDPKFTEFEYTRFVFVGSFFSLLTINLVIAFREAYWEWTMKASALVGDLVEESRLDKFSAFMALVVMRFFLVEGFVKDIVIWLHPWKSVQPFAALKMENTRAYVVGFQSEYLFRVENKAGQQLLLPVHFLTKMLILCFKVYWAIYLMLPTDRIVMAASSASTFASSVWLCVKLVRLISDRHCAHKGLMEQVKDPKSVSKDTDEARKKQAVARKLLAQHFGLDHTAGKTRWISADTWFKNRSKSDIKGCMSCGRMTKEQWASHREQSKNDLANIANIKVVDETYLKIGTIDRIPDTLKEEQLRDRGLREQLERGDGRRHAIGVPQRPATSTLSRPAEAWPEQSGDVHGSQVEAWKEPERVDTPSLQEQREVLREQVQREQVVREQAGNVDGDMPAPVPIGACDDALRKSAAADSGDGEQQQEVGAEENASSTQQENASSTRLLNTTSLFNNDAMWC